MIYFQVWDGCLPPPQQTLQLLGASAITISSHEGLWVLWSKLARIDDGVAKADESEAQALSRGDGAEAGR
jgi:hypothetical protein